MHFGVVTALELYSQLRPFDPEQAEAIARAFLAEEGDLPESIWHTLAHNQRDPKAMRERLLELREEHFRALGKRPREYTGNWE